jgi:hypothetical protein
MHELRRKGQEIADLNDQLQAQNRQSKTAHVLRGQIEALYRETAIISEEWAAEVQYVHVAKDLLAEFVRRESETETLPEDGAQLPALITGLEALEVAAKLEARCDFALLQTLSEGAQAWFGFKPKAALADHREFLNEILSANNLDPFLLRLTGNERDLAANLLGRAIVAVVPDERIADLRSGEARLSEFPGFDEAVRALKEQALEHSSNFGARVIERLQKVEA